jgi:N-acyl-D-aspartate/D-glutamate deacylase
VEEQLGTWFLRADIGHRDTAAVGAMLAHPLVHVGASDAGAHVGTFSTYGDTGYLLSRYVRETGALRLEDAVKKITADTADIWGLAGRGRLVPGAHADVCVFDPATIDRGPELAAHDFPGGGFRWVRHAVGTAATVVGGEVVWTAQDGYTAATPGAIATR